MIIAPREAEAPKFGKRHLQCALLFFAFFAVFASQVNLSVAIVAMTTSNSTSNTTGNLHQKLKYSWSEKTKSIVLSSFFWGYCVTQIPGGPLAHKFGSKVLIIQCLLITTILNLLTPLAVKYGGWKLLCAFRIMQGLSQGVIFPSGHTLLSKWTPTTERGTFSTFSYQGIMFGTVVMLAISGVLASSSFGWASIFYVSGVICFLSSIAWIFWGASTPNDCKSISAEEELLIETSLGKTQQMKEGRSTLKTPWKGILTSVPFWVLLVAHLCDNFGFWTLLAEIPTYMYHVMGVDIKNNALISALPYVAFILLGYSFCALSDILQKRHCISLTANRKLFNSICMWIPMISLIVLGYISADHVKIVVISFIITIGFNSACLVGWNINHIDLSPNFGGILMGLSSFAGSIAGLLAPMMVGFIVSDEKNPAQWRIVFLIAGGFYFVGNLLFICFGTAKVQPWNQPAIKIDEVDINKIPKVI